MDGEGDVEGLVEALGIGSRERLGGFLRGLSVTDAWEWAAGARAYLGHGEGAMWL